MSSSLARHTSLTYKLGASVLGTLSYAYDSAGKRTHLGGTWARTGLPAPIGSSSYDGANQQLALGGNTMSFDQNGNLATLTEASGLTMFTWDARNRLSGLTGPGITAAFGYDGLDRRWTKTVNGARTDFLYDGVNPVQELSGGMVLANLLTGLGIDEYFARTDASGTRGLLADALGSTVALTDPSGFVATEYTYEPFGATTVTGVSSTNAYAFTGRENDATDLYYYRARYYRPGLARFMREDPLGFAGDTNLYAYVRNSPANGRDPSGLLVVNATSNTIYVKPEYEPTAVPVAAWSVYAHLHDGLAVPCDRPNEVFKSPDFAPAIVFPGGFVLGIGVWLGEEWLKELHKLGDHGWDRLFAASRAPQGGGARYGTPCK